MRSADLVVLDTHVWIWWASDPKKLTAKARKVLTSARELGLPAVCCWELAMLVSAGRLKLDREVRDWVHDALELPGLKLLELSPDIGVTAGLIERSFHGDPIDRMIVATALELRAPLITADDRLHDWPGLQTVW